MKDNSPDDQVSITFNRYIPLIVWVAVVATLIFIPFKIFSLGFMPLDDALRHAAKGVSGKTWSQILVLNPAYKIDHEFGWNLLLEKLHQWLNLDESGLVAVSVIGLFLVVTLVGLAWVRRPEAWLAALILASGLYQITVRHMFGRPFLITEAALMCVLFLWERYRSSSPRPTALVIMTFLVGTSTYFHGPWYLWLMVVGAFVAAEQYRWAINFAGCWVAGVLLGSCLTGHPFAYPLQAITLLRLAVGTHENPKILAAELLPTHVDLTVFFVVCGLFALQRLARIPSISLFKRPTFWLMLMGWTLGLKVSRFWYDWGMPATLVLVATEVDTLFEHHFNANGLRRLVLALFLSVTCYICCTNDADSRWSGSLTKVHLAADNPKFQGWLPDHGGIFYTADMLIFYDTFYSNPHGDWRYMLGFEPTWMPKEDFDTFYRIMWNYGDAQAYDPWVQKMKPADRLVIRNGVGMRPAINALEWNDGGTGIWIGRLPRTNSPAAKPPTP